eukprot:scaffold30840_cov36-Cyclotella_meneghiniana.AAC.2
MCSYDVFTAGSITWLLVVMWCLVCGVRSRGCYNMVIVKKSSACSLSTGSRPVNVTPACPRLTVAGVTLFDDCRLRHDCRLSTLTFVAIGGSYLQIPQ